MSQPNCMTCKHLGRERTGELICEPLVGLLWCESCKTADALTSFSALAATGGGRGAIIHAGCRKAIQPLVTDDWREGYIGKPVDGFMTPLPSCPGWEQAEQPAKVKAPPKPRPVTKSLFD